MNNICNICEWEYNSEYQCKESVVKQDHNWEEIPKDFQELLPGAGKES